MARPLKQGLDYFPLDVQLDDKFKFIEIKFGIEGFGIVIKLLQKIYSTGYWYEWSEDTALLFASDHNLDTDKLNQIIKESVKRGIFDKSIYENHSVLTSKGIQKRYYEVSKRRKCIEIVKDYILFDDLMQVNVDNNEDNVDIKPTTCKQDVNKSTERKGKERKQKEKGKNKDLIVDVIDYLNKKADKNFKYSTKATVNHINARVKEGFTKEQMMEVVDKKVSAWGGDPKMEEFLRPQTLFGTKMESYVNEKSKVSDDDVWKDILEGYDD